MWHGKFMDAIQNGTKCVLVQKWNIKLVVLTFTFTRTLILDFNDNPFALWYVPLQFVHWTYCQVYNCYFAKIIFTKLSTKASLVVPWILKWTYTQTHEYNLENTCLKHNANLKWKLNVMKLTGHESSPIHNNSQVKWSPFHTSFGWKSCPILVIPNISKALA